MTDAHAERIQWYMRGTEHGNGLMEAFPRLADVVDALPDISGLVLCNVMIREVFDDVIEMFRELPHPSTSRAVVRTDPEAEVTT